MLAFLVDAYMGVCLLVVQYSDWLLLKVVSLHLEHVLSDKPIRGHYDLDCQCQLAI